MHTRIHKTHHSSDLGEAITFPLIIFSVISYGGYIQMSFCFGSPEIPKIEIPGTLEGHNFLCKPLIEVKFETKF